MTEFNHANENISTADFARRTRGNDEAVVESWPRDLERRIPESRSDAVAQNQYDRNDAGYGATLDAAPARGEVTSFPSRREAEFASTTATLSPTQSVPGAMPLFSEGKITEMRTRWNNIQAEFVDEPRRSVEQADQLVAAAMQQLAEGFAAERASLEQQWESGDNVSTEDLRVALQRYRAFFGRLLNVA
jgi:hypothetical protein